MTLVVDHVQNFVIYDNANINNIVNVQYEQEDLMFS